MFDFSKIGMIPGYSDDFEPGATEEQIRLLEKHCGHSLPENYKYILKNYNGGWPQTRDFIVTETFSGVPEEWELGGFYILNEQRELPINIWWIIEQYSGYMGSNTLPFADDGLQQVYFLKWINNIPQVWFLAFLDIDEPETFPLMSSFDELLGALYNAE